MRFRQVHLDFHTSEKIMGIGSEFNKEQFQSVLKAGHVNSVTVFSKCHHGYAFHPSKANEMHPNLDFDLLGAQIEKLVSKHLFIFQQDLMKSKQERIRNGFWIIWNIQRIKSSRKLIIMHYALTLHILMCFWHR